MAEMKLTQNEFDEPTKSDEELVEFVVSHTDRWRDWRDSNYLESWQEYERIFRGVWDAADSTRSSERSRIISPATQQAVETRHAEIVEAIFGNGEYFDIADDIADAQTLDVAMLKKQMQEDLDKEQIKKYVSQVELLAEIYGTGIAEIIVNKKQELIPTTMPMPDGTAAYGVMEKDYTCIKVNPINPKNFLIDPNATTVEDAMGVAIEKYVSIHKVVEGMEKGIYRKVDIGPIGEDSDLEPTQETSQFQDDKVLVLTYYGLAPREYIEQLENDGAEVVDLFPDDSIADKYSDLVECIIVVANGNKLLKAEKNPYMMKDRPVVAYQDDSVPGRFYGRGTVEKAYNMQKAIDAQLRAHMDSLALTTAPMVAMDATRLPRGAKFEVKPGKAILTNGNPSEILFPFKFGTTDNNNLATSQNFERMLLQATGTVDASGQPTSFTRDGGGAQVSMSVAGIIKKYKRTLMNFQEDFMVPLIRKAAYRFMQFDPERYPTVDLKFTPLATLGIIAREYEQQQLIALLQTLGPDTPVLPLILKGILQSSSLANKAEMEAKLDEMMQPNPEQQAMQQAEFQLATATAQENLKKLQSETAKNMTQAQKTATETQLMPMETQAKLAQGLSANIRGNNTEDEFAKRAKIAELALKEADINSNERIAYAQMSKKMQ